MKKREKVKIKAKVTFEWEYEVDPEHYVYEIPLEKLTVQDMIKIDEGGFEDDHWMFIDCCNNAPTLELMEVKDGD